VLEDAAVALNLVEDETICQKLAGGWKTKAQPCAFGPMERATPFI
jgi:hypothetical protein